jgi:hypothetical protein
MVNPMTKLLSIGSGTLPHLRRCGQRLLVAFLVVVATAPAEAARVFHSGFELQTTTDGIEWYDGTPVTAAGAINTSGTFVRSGAASLRVTSPSTGVSKGQSTRFVSSGSNGVDYFLRSAFYFATMPNQATGIMGFGDAATANRVRVRLNTAGTLSVVVDSTEVAGTGSTVLVTGQWYLIELRAKRDATSPGTGADTVELRLNTATELAAVTNASINGTWNRAVVGLNLFAATDTATTGDVYIDDVALNDSSGTAQTGYPGAGSIALLTPNGAGEFDQGTALAGSAAAATAWQSVDDGIATGTVDGTDYVVLDANATSWTLTGDRFAVAMSSMPTASAVALVTIHAYVTNNITTNGAAANSGYSLGVQIANGGTKSTASSGNINFNKTWTLNIGGVARSVAPLTLYTDPDSASWTETKVNSLQAMFRSDDGTPSVEVTSMWAMVEYTPGVAAAPSKQILLLGVGN